MSSPPSSSSQYNSSLVARVIMLACWLGSSACGRVGFDAVADAALAAGPSCAGLAATCGPAGTSLCCGSPLVPGGTFYRSYDVASDDMYPDVTHPATVSDFRLDTYEATVGRFRRFVDAGLGTQASPPAAGVGARMLNGVANQDGWDPTWNANLAANSSALTAAVQCPGGGASWTDVPGANESLPMNCITWWEAFAFCAWDGGFLPTEAQWNYAAAGGSEQRAYPWSSPAGSLTITCSNLDFKDGATMCVNPPNGAVNRVGSESPDGDGKYGQADLAGNVFEWTLDSFEDYLDPCTDCADLVPGSQQASRSNSFYTGSANARVAQRQSTTPTQRDAGLGVRCARAP
jgi:formylglycine-generating enzyme required for sulfatase activity